MSGKDPLRLAILISGRGSNMVAIARACAEGRINARIALVVSERPGAAGLDAARDLGIEARVIAWRGATERVRFEGDLDAALADARPDLIVLAGFMRILSERFVAAHAGRILNIHPSLLPQYRGLHTHRRVLEAGELVHGASAHYVTAELDGGPLILQSRVAVRTGDSEDTLSARVQATEHIIYPRVIGWLAEGRLAWRDDQPWLDGRPLTAPVVEEFP
ncbi:MAG TPA: phosphoribosylglycinamide formyltransferase [Steroidobacteraceae bacterium]|nr:phosphoribosylglycinamide formyltransferase [Steroidobacteraceae bacterium]